MIIINKEQLKEQVKEFNIERIPVLKAVRNKCLNCCCGQRLIVESCPCPDCPLWPFRLGINPFTERNMSEEQKKAVVDRFKQYRENNKGDIINEED